MENDEARSVPLDYEDAQVVEEDKEPGSSSDDSVDSSRRSADAAASSKQEGFVPQSRRASHFDSLLRKSRASLVMSGKDASSLLVGSAAFDQEDADEVEGQEVGVQHTASSTQFSLPEQDDGRLVEVRVRDYSYHIPIKIDAPSVKTVGNQSLCYATYEFIQRISNYFRALQEAQENDGANPQLNATYIVLPFRKKAILNNLNLVFKPGRTYLVLGPPASGKTSLLKAVSGRLPSFRSLDKPHQEGRIEYNGVSPDYDDDAKDICKPNVVSFVGQLDNHAPYLTVSETFEYALQCRTGGNNRTSNNNKLGENSTTAAATDGDDDALPTENLTIDGLGLKECEHTFVGNENVRGVSGGQRRRVTVGEMMQGQNPVACADEISTGLDAAVTYDIVHSIVAFAKAAKTTRIVSLLQPGPETFSLFDEVILLAEGHVIYAGPIDEAVGYFEQLGYKQLSTMDVADFLQLLPTSDGAMLFDASRSPQDEHYTAVRFAAAFRESAQYDRIARELEDATPSPYNWKKKKDNDVENGGGGGATSASGSRGGVPEEFKVEYQNSFWSSCKLNLARHFTLWKRDKGYIIGKMFENIGMAAATGGILFGAGRFDLDPNDPFPEIEDRLQAGQKAAEELSEVLAGIYGALFMTTFHILLGTSTSAPDEVDQRMIHYKHCDANFYQTGAFNIGRLISTFPQRTIEIVSFGIPLYFMVGLYPSAGAFFTYLALLICYTIGIKQIFSVLAQTMPKKANVQGVGTFIVLLLTLFSGFIVYPDAIPGYYKWIHWMNPMAWAIQGLAAIEFMSDKYEDFPKGGALFLETRGFHAGREWIGYSFCYMIPFTLLSTLILNIVLRSVRIEPEKQHVKKKAKVSIGQAGGKPSGDFNLPFIPVDLTFDKLVYEVKASTSNETLRLLNEVSGAFRAGRMCALMGSSGAGKTTLMDVIAMRKTSGTITGEIKLNGFPQERTSFLRCSGYVEQFDVQQPELTVRETVTFCARLRLDASDPAIGDDAGKLRYVDHVLETMELTDIQTLQVGSYEEGGLSFEQRKRLAIACELAGSPSVLFLDEPTSGLDSRGALLVMRAMKRIADTGRTVCATIHQPSSAVFEMFDDLLLLKRGGNTVFFGELGEGSVKLIEYFEAHGATPIMYGENPAAWMLRAYAGEQASADVDWAEVYKASDEYSTLCSQIEDLTKSPDDSKKIHFESVFATDSKERLHLINKRILTIYKRSPAYNLTRVMIALSYAFLIGSVFIRGSSKRRSGEWTENEVDGVLGTIFLSTIIIGTTSISMAVPVMKRIRDVFYKHRASGMIEHGSLSSALFSGELPYLLLMALCFGAVFYFTVGLFGTVKKFWYFFLFFSLNVATYAFFGQAFICLVPDVPTSGALVGALIGYNIFFSGFIVRPKYFRGPFQLGLWTAPGRFAYEGIVMTQFKDVIDLVRAEDYSPFYFWLNCGLTTDSGLDPQPCSGTMEDYVEFFFGGKFSIDNFWLDCMALVGYVLLARILIWFSLKTFNYVNT